MTASDIDAFEVLFGLPVNGKLNIDSWPTLVAQVTPLVAGESTGLPVEALQDLLLASGTASVDLAVNGVFDAATVDALAAFQVSHGVDAASQGGTVVDAQSWHLLATQCNGSDPSGSSPEGHFWFDAGWPQGSLSVDQLGCFRQAGFEYAVFECW